MKIRILGAAAAVLFAIIGTLSLTGYVRGADARALAGTETRDVYVLTQAVPANTPAEQLSGSLTVRPVPAAVIPEGAVTDLTSLAGKVTAVDMVPGEQLLSARLIDPASLSAPGTVPVPKGMQEVTVQLSPDRVAGGKITAGDTVGVLVSFSDSADGKPATHQVFHKVFVTGVQGAPAPAKEDTAAGSTPAPAGAIMVTLARNAPDAERIVFAAEFGTLWLTKEPADAAEAGTRTVTKDGYFK